ncbi:chaperonin 10-like protein [Cristinia sonorae]|uniref:Chaperonin 10-like protein n=1 Tax=Cristinia sonorae TaxID=1940300 RepID=A0A8K0UDG4_9AGAR|nr:chaperonin 10-like protein [Cristinia sonorae]
MAIPTKHKALLLLSHAGSYEIRDVDVPMPDAGEVLIRVEAAALNPSDWRTRHTEYSFILPGYPAHQGSDAAGVVVALGEGVTRFKVGDRVLHQGSYSNGEKLAAFQQYTAVPTDLVAKIPDNLTFDQAATIPLALATSAIAFYQKRLEVDGGGGAGLLPFWKEGGRGKYSGKPILIFGGASACGQYGIQFARLSGFSPVITTVSPSNMELALSLGATHTIDRSLSADALIEAVKAITSKPFHFIYDSVSSEETQNIGYDLLAPGGTIVILLRSAVKEDKLTRDKTILTCWGSVHLDMHKEFGAEMYQHITKWFEIGYLRTTATEYVPGGLSNIPGAQERVRSGKVGPRKLVVHPSETI